MLEKCTVPPVGWLCARAAGHDGPCAAYVDSKVIGEMKRSKLPRKKLFGFSEIWREDSTGTTCFYFLGLRVWKKDFTHSTWLWD